MGRARLFSGRACVRARVRISGVLLYGCSGWAFSVDTVIFGNGIRQVGILMGYHTLYVKGMAQVLIAYFCGGLSMGGSSRVGQIDQYKA